MLRSGTRANVRESYNTCHWVEINLVTGTYCFSRGLDSKVWSPNLRARRKYEHPVMLCEGCGEAQRDGNDRAV